MKYKYIHAWGKMMGSFPYYINNQVAKAIEENAPETAIFRSSYDGTWATFEGIENKDTKLRIASIVKSFSSVKTYKAHFHLNGKYDLIFTVEAIGKEEAVTVATQELTDDNITNHFIINLIEIS